MDWFSGELVIANGVISEEPGSKTLDLEGVRIAEASGYSRDRIQKAIISFFRQTSESDCMQVENK